VICPRTFLICLVAWLGFGSSLRAEYASVMAPAAEDGALEVLLPNNTASDDVRGASAGLRFLSPIYLEQYHRGSMGGALPALPPLLPLPIDMNDEGAGAPPLIDSPTSTPVATLTGEFQLVADPRVSHFLPFRDRIVLQEAGSRLFRPPRRSFRGALATDPPRVAV
jgi:hypothetical protein